MIAEVNQHIVRLEDASQIEFVVNIPESEISVIFEVTYIRVQVDAFPGLEVPAQIKEIDTVTTMIFVPTLYAILFKIRDGRGTGAEPEPAPAKAPVRRLRLPAQRAAEGSQGKGPLMLSSGLLGP